MIRTAHSSTRTGILAALAAFVLLCGFGLAHASSAHALACTGPLDPVSLTTPLPGSCFEGFDGTQLDPDGATPAPPAAPNRLDWQSILSVTSTADDFTSGGSDSQFGSGGSEETPDSWTFDFGSLGSDKYDIVNGYIARHREYAELVPDAFRSRFGL